MTPASGPNDAGRSGGEPSTSTSLLERVKRHDPEGWRRLAQFYSPMVYAWCRRSGVAREDAEDVLQNVFVAVYSHLGRFRRDRPDDSFRGWLWTITQNRIRDHFRGRGDAPLALGGSSAQQRMLQLPENASAESVDSTGPCEDAAWFPPALAPVRAEFEPRTWQAFWRFAVEGATAAEVAAELGISPNAVRLAKFRVLRRLREEFHGLID